MKKKLLKWLYVFLSVAVLMTGSNFEIYAQKIDDDTNKEIKKVLVKYKDGTLDNEKKVQQKKASKVIMDYKKTGNKNVYIFELETASYNELLADDDIELVEEDSPIEVMEEIENINSCVCDNCSCETEYDCESCTCNDLCECDDCISESECDCESCTCDEVCDCENIPKSLGIELNGEIVDLSERKLVENPEVPVESTQEIKLLEEGTDGKTYSSGDKAPWNITRVRADKLHEAGITGNGVKVAVFDTGIDLDNSDLDVAGGVSFVDGVASYDDDNGHGTAMAGVLAAKLNGTGLVGIAPDIELYAVKVMDEFGVGRYSSVLQAVDWAIENNIKIITMSFGGSQYSQILAEAIKRATDNNILVVAASGNNGENTIFYPAIYQPVICVGATDSYNCRAVFSNYGEQMDLTAPGAEIETLGLNSISTSVEGTSAAVQHVAGIAALLWSADSSLTNGQVKFLLYNNAFDLGNMQNYGYGMVDAEKAYENLLTGDYSITVVDEQGEEITIPGQIDVGGDGLFSAQTSCSCTGCYQGSSYYNYSEHNSTYGGHRRVYYCGLSTCRSLHLYTCVYGTSTYDKLGSCGTCCCSLGNHLWPASASGFEAYHMPGLGHRYYKNCTRGCGAYTYTGTYKTDYSSCCDCVGHSWGSWTVTLAATCTTAGSQTRTCTRNSSHTETQSIPALGHLYGAWVVTFPPTCTMIGYQTRTCIRNSSHTETQSIPALGHSPNTSVIYYETSHPHAAYYLCSRCSSKIYTGSYGFSYSCPSCHTHNYSTKVVSSTHTTTGHYCYWQCTCGSTTGDCYEAVDTCMFCTTSPSLIITGPSADHCFSDTDTNCQPIILVSDNFNDTLTCKYYIDSVLKGTETVTDTSISKMVTFSTGFNPSSLTEGSHTLRVDVTDGLTPLTTASISFKVDKSAPTLGTVITSSSSSTITLGGSATDSIAGLNSYPYMYTIGSTSTYWLTKTSHTWSGLTPNTQYSIKLEVKDAKNHIVSNTQSKYTQAQMPSISIGNMTSNTLEVSTSDCNPSCTEYQICTGTYYVTQSGTLSTTPAWITLTGQKITVTGLTPSTVYSFIAKARNADNIETASCPAVSLSTLEAVPGVPSAVTLVAAYNSIAVSWSAVPEAEGYDIMVDNGSPINNALSLTYNSTGLTPGTQHTYCVRARNSGGAGSWSAPVSISTTTSADPAQNANITNTYNISCANDEEFNVSLFASNVFDFDTPSFTITYNPNEVDVTDLCGFTPDADIAAGAISGTDITVTQFVPGTIVFKINRTILAGQAFNGIVNSIGFKSKVSGQVGITYKMQ